MYKSQQSGKRRREHDDGGDRYKKPRFSPSEQKIMQLRREIVEIGEPSRFKLSSMLDQLGNRLVDVHDSEIRNAVYGTLFVTIVEQPHKIPLLAGSIIIANSRNSTMGQVAIEMAHTRLEAAIQQCNWAHVKFYMRFIASLGPIIEGDGVERAFRDLLAKAVELSQSQYTHVACEILTGVLLNLPNAVASYPSSSRDTVVAYASDIVAQSKSFSVNEDNTKLASLVGPFRKDSDSSPYEPREWVALVRSAIESLAEDGWRLDKLLDIPTLIEPFVNQGGGAAEAGEQDIKKHQFSTLNMSYSPETLDASLAGSKAYPRIFFQTYLPDKYETVPPVASFESVYFRSLCCDIIGAMEFNRREVTRQLITLDLFFSSSAFAEPGIPFDRLQKEADEGRSTWKVEDVAVEAVLEHIFRLSGPSSPDKTVNVYYHSILIESCVMAPQALAPVLGRAIRFLYSSIDSLDIEAYFNYVQWLAHHLSNFNFTWKWNEWLDDLQLAATSPRRAFVSNLIQKLERLSYYVRLKETLPEEFLVCLPRVSEDLAFPYGDDDHPLRNEVEGLMTALKKLKEQEEHREDDEDEDVDESSQREGDGGEEDDDDKSSTETEVHRSISKLKDAVMTSHVGGAASEVSSDQIKVIFSTVCYLGSRSLSHIDSWISCSKKVLRSVLLERDTDELAAVRAVFAFWKEQPHVALWICQMLVNHSVLTSAQPLLEVLFTDTTDMNISEQMPYISTAVGWEAFVWALDQNPDLVTPVAKMLNSVDTTSNGDLAWWVDGYCRALVRRYNHAVNRDEFAGLDRFAPYV